MIQKQTAFSAFKKFVAALLITVLIFPHSWQFDNVKSQGADAEYDLVVIFADAQWYTAGKEDSEESITGKVYRYARDVQDALGNTKTLVLPVSSEENSLNLYKVLEKMYLEGYQKDATVSFLKGIVLIGDIPLPTIQGNLPFVSVFPYIDFEDPAFLWNEESQVFTPNEESSSITAEVWHGVIRGSEEDISAYFDRNHTYHQALKNGEAPYNDEVLYADFTDEQGSISSFSLDQYELTQEYAEDIAYKRYNKNLLKKLQEELHSSINDSEGIDDDNDGKIDEDLFDLEDNDGDGLIDEDDGLPEGLESQENDEFFIPDIHTRQQIRQILPEYLQAIPSTSSELQERVTNSGRWSESQVDTVPKLITTLDILTREAFKEINTILEEQTLQVVRSWQKPVDVIESVTLSDFPTDTLLLNKINGRLVSSFETAEDCSLLKGSNPTEEYPASQMVEYNRLYDPNTAGTASEQCDPYGECCIQNLSAPNQCVPGEAEESVFSWGGNTPQIKRRGSSFLNCNSEGFLLANSSQSDWKDIRYTAISSMVIHDAPRAEHIQNALENISGGHIPSDAQRFVNFMNMSGQLEKVDFLSSFDFDPKTPEDIFSTFLSFIESKESVLEKKMITDALLNFAQYLFVRTGQHDLSRPIDVNLLPEEFLNIFSSYITDIEHVLREEYPEQDEISATWIQAVRSASESVKGQAEAIFNRHFTPVSNGITGQWKRMFLTFLNEK